VEIWEKRRGRGKGGIDGGMVSSGALFASLVVSIASESAVAIVRSLVVVGFLSFFVSLGRSLNSLSSSEAARFNADLEAMVSQISDTEKIRMMDE
jgi:hypothetical protein